MAFALLLALLLVYGGRLAISAHQHLAQGDAARRTGDIPSAVIHYRHAIESHVPLGGVGEIAIERLVDLGDQAARAGRRGDALFAFRSARFGVLSLRHVVIPFEEKLPAIHRAIEAQEHAAGAQAAAGQADLLGGYRSRGGPSGLGFLFDVGFLGWLVSLFTLVWLGFGPDGKTRPALRWIAPVSALLLVFWIFVLSAA